jgi:hypothetical protein
VEEGLKFSPHSFGRSKDDMSRGWANVGLRAVDRVGRVGRTLDKDLLEAVSEKFDPGNRGGMIYSTI